MDGEHRDPKVSNPPTWRTGESCESRDRAQPGPGHDALALIGPVVDALPAPAVVVDAQLRIVVVNTAWNDARVQYRLDSEIDDAPASYADLCQQLFVFSSAEREAFLNGVRHLTQGQRRDINVVTRLANADRVKQIGITGRRLSWASGSYAILVHKTLAEEAGTARADVKRARQQSTILHDASRVLTTGSEDDALQRIARLPVPALADLCLIHQRADDTLRAVALACTGAARRVATKLAQAPPDELPTVARDGRPLVVPNLPGIPHVPLTRIPQARSTLIVPLVGHDGVLGTLTLAVLSGARRLTTDDLALAEILAHQAAAAIERVELRDHAERAIQAREAFLTIAAHELKTPVAGIKLLGQGLLRRLRRTGTLDSHQVEVSVSILMQEIDRLTELVNDLLDATRLREHRLQLHAKRIDLAQLTVNVIDRFTGALEKRPQHRIVVDAPDPVVGAWDPGQVEQVIINLVSNALKFSPRGGEVRITVGINRGDALLSVRDHGIGITREVTEHLFDPFSRDSAAHPGIEGIGLGLYITRQIVELHGGTIAITGAPGDGTTATVRLPLADDGR